MTGDLDPRLNPYRADLAAQKLKGKVSSRRFANAVQMQVTDQTAPVFAEPRADAEMTAEALHGELIDVYEESDGWVWGQLSADGYVGYMPSRALSSDIASPTHKVMVPRTFVYPVADIKSVPVRSLTLNAGLRIVGTEGEFSRTADGHFVFTAHIGGIETFASDFVAVAETLLGAPYLWGGKTIGGLDCSGLVQLACQVAGIAALRDSYMQRDHLGRPLTLTDFSVLQRGDILFWKGHVGIMADGKNLLHATAHAMLTIVEPAEPAIRRIAQGGSEILQVNRL